SDGSVGILAKESATFTLSWYEDRKPNGKNGYDLNPCSTSREFCGRLEREGSLASMKPVSGHSQAPLSRRLLFFLRSAPRFPGSMIPRNSCRRSGSGSQKESGSRLWWLSEKPASKKSTG